ncbi:MAG: hypothetical protein IJI22_01595 [Bacilli bacterium]|nr:hypothetical protein [Bacilli bacterium]
MTRSELEVLITKRKLELEKPFERSVEYEMFSDFCKNHFIAKAEDLIGYDMEYCLKLLYFAQTKYTPCEEDAKKIVNDVVLPIISSLELPALDRLIKTCSVVTASDEKDKVLQFLREKSTIKSKLLYYSLNLDPNIIADLDEFRKFCSKKDLLLGDLFELYFDDSLLINNMMSIYLMAKAIEENIKEIDSVYEETLSDLDVSRREAKLLENKKKKHLKKGLAKIEGISIALGLFSKIAEEVRKEEKKESDYNKNRYKEIANLDQVMLLLDEGLETPEIKDVRRIIGLIKDSEIKRAVLEIIYEHNMKYYKKLSKEFEQLNGNNSVKYQTLLNNFGLVIDSKSIEAVMYNSLEDVETILKIISGIGYDSTTLFRILKNTDIETVKMIKSYIDRGILTDSFILNNYDIFCSDSTKTLLLKNNILLFESYNLNPNMFSNNGNILISNSLVLQNNFEVLKNYDLLSFLKTTDNYQFLIDNELLVKIERLLELGYEKLLEEDLGILNVCDIKRLEVLNSLNMPVQDLETFYGVCQSKKFFIRDDEIDNYLLNVLDFNEEVALDIDSSDLEKYRISTRLYNINGINVASNKVLRNISEGMSMYQAIFRGMILNEEEYSAVIGELKPIQYQ